MTTWTEQLKWNSDGLVPVITQDFHSKRILTLAWLNHEALTAAVAEKRAVYWSRSRNRLWRKGEESGHIQKLHGIYLDCDGDAVCFVVEQVGGIACHTGRESCFHNRLNMMDAEAHWEITDPVLKDPAAIYRNAVDEPHG